MRKEYDDPIRIEYCEICGEPFEVENEGDGLICEYCRVDECFGDNYYD